MGLDGVRLIIDEVSRCAAQDMKIPSNVITSWTNVPRSICLQVGYYREFTPNGCDEIEWGLVGGPVWKLMVDLEGFDLTIATIILNRLGNVSWLVMGTMEESSQAT